ncbi:TQXA domain-containing protein [Candidatus Mycolicibacterium alkanivorans]|uniref:TQXA domain-containing protein n=1 Tax=Candidatus Mycolicibacterium alkanivorans TaxID=2954114 RepID=A0ABS9YSV6_9MYCO|nr:TQXA domain-containing protein [Candidatus Mycolicibacterium alkanivorans]MCI4674291.1 TQXA domain-containing protein [Candidatus Mycolicibacterium alkanivorans]
MTILSLPVDAPAPVAVRRRVSPTPSVDLSRMTRYRPGTYSHTVDTIVFTDGTSARTDLIRLNPNIEAYSLDFAGIAPSRPSRYRADTWSAVPHLQARAHEAEVDWILRNSFPTLSTTEISRRLRAAGYPLGNRNIAEHEAIAGTQAAIWRLTNGLELDDRPLNVPTRVVHGADAVSIEFDGERQLAGYAAVVTSSGEAVLTLQKSADGLAWEDVASSKVRVTGGVGEVRQVLGVGSTMSDSRHGRASHGYRHYRLVIDGAAAIGELSFQLHGSRVYRNAEPIVFLSDHLLTGARSARRLTVTPSLLAAAATVEDSIVGPLRLATTDSAAVRASDGHAVVDADGAEIIGPLQPGAEFFLRARPGAVAATLTVEVPGCAAGFGGRVITGVARDEVAGGYTPLALAVPAALVVEFDVEWSVEESAAL